MFKLCVYHFSVLLLVRLFNIVFTSTHVTILLHFSFLCWCILDFKVGNLVGGCFNLVGLSI